MEFKHLAYDHVSMYSLFEGAPHRMIRWLHIYPLIGLIMNILLGVIFYWFGGICASNYDAMGFTLPTPTLWVLRFPYFYYLLSALVIGLLCLSLIGKISDRLLFGFAFGIVVIDTGLLFISALSYVMPYLVFPVSLE